MRERYDSYLKVQPNIYIFQKTRPQTDKNSGLNNFSGFSVKCISDL